VSPALGVLVGYGVFLALILGMVYVPLVTGTLSAIGLGTVACIEAGARPHPERRHRHRLRGGFLLVGLMAGQHAPRKRRTSP
jgi:hypothetical protein